MKPISIIGAGAWGTALAVLLGTGGVPVLLWCRRAELADRLHCTRRNEAYLPGIRLPDSVEVTARLERAADASRHLVLAVPSQALRTIARRLASALHAEHRILVASKGLEAESGRRLSEVLQEAVPHLPPAHIAVLSGPNHAVEVARGVPSASVVASAAPETAREWQEILMQPSFRVYRCDDVIGVELGGALKNVIALAAGIADGLGYGDNSRAALATRGLAEMVRLGVALGARPPTYFGLAGVGDLMVTCNSRHSRNRRAGEAIGRGAEPASVKWLQGHAVEGIPTCAAAHCLALRHGVDMPIVHAIYRVLFEGAHPRQAVNDLMRRDPKEEWEANLWAHWSASI